MAEISFRCPVTNQRVQAWTASETDGSDIYEAIPCTACQRVHLVNPKSGRVIGRREDCQ